VKLAFVLASAAPAGAARIRGREVAAAPRTGAQDDEVAVVCAVALARRGHEVTLLGTGARPGWLPAPLTYRDLLGPADGVARQDLLLATSWCSIAAARSLRAGPVTHLCHRFEGELATSDEEAEAIDRAYSVIPAGLAVSAGLAELLEHRFGRASHVVALPAEDGFRARFRWRPGGSRRILVAGSEEDPRGLEVILRVAARLAPADAPARARAQVRVLEPAAGDRAGVAVWPRAVYAKILRQCDLALLAQHSPVLRLLQCAASAVPVAVLDGGPCADLARRSGLETPAADGETLFLQADALLRSGAAWRSARRECGTLGRRVREQQVVTHLERAVAELARGLD
jgi:hypothetical protein